MLKDTHPMITTLTLSESISTKKHFEILDGLRGIAAISVVIFHFIENVYLDYSRNFIGHGFLAVDFFFCLSGFVIAYAYDDRIRNIGVKKFLKLRLIRLHPLVILGSCLGLIGFFADPFANNAPYGFAQLMQIFLSSVLLIPFPIMADRGFNLFGLNPPAWSLFWEYVVNIIYAFVLYKIARKYLLWLTILAAIPLCIVCYKADSLMGGWGGPNFWDGGVRVSFSFLAGLLVYRSKWIIKNRFGFLGLSILLILAFIMPYTKWNFITEPLVIIVYFPLIIALGAGTVLRNSVKNLCIFAGKISYPIYMTHYVAIFIFANYYNKYKPDSLALTTIIIIGTLLLIGFAYLMMIIYDTPIRKYLAKSKILKKE